MTVVYGEHLHEVRIEDASDGVTGIVFEPLLACTGDAGQ
jgi:hypothetical protein